MIDAILDYQHWSSHAVSAARITVIVLVAVLVISVLQRAIRALRQQIASRLDDPEAVKRAETLGRVFRYLVGLVVGVIASLMVLSELGVSLAPVLGAAGVAGIAIGFGAQSLVKDFFSGFFILFENQIRTGDVVRIAGHSGLVEEVTLRHVRLRDLDGYVHFVPCGMIDSVVNLSRGHAYALIEASVAYREDTDEVCDVLRDVAANLRADPAFSSLVLDDVEVLGVERWESSAVVIRCRIKTPPLQQWAVRREFLRRLKKAFEQRGIEIPYPHLTVYAGVDKLGNAPPIPVRAVER